jgi:hypothetical protein
MVIVPLSGSFDAASLTDGARSIGVVRPRNGNHSIERNAARVKAAASARGDVSVTARLISGQQRLASRRAS